MPFAPPARRFPTNSTTYSFTLLPQSFLFSPTAHFKRFWNSTTRCLRVLCTKIEKILEESGSSRLRILKNYKTKNAILHIIVQTCLHIVWKLHLCRQDGASRPQGNSTISGLRGHSQGAIISYNVSVETITKMRPQQKLKKTKQKLWNKLQQNQNNFKHKLSRTMRDQRFVAARHVFHLGCKAILGSLLSIPAMREL